MLTLLANFLLPSSYVGTAAMWRATNDKAQTEFDVCNFHVSTLESIYKEISEVYEIYQRECDVAFP